MADAPPHFPATLQFRFGRWITVDQDSAAHASECAELVLRTPQGTMEFDAELGLADLVGTVGLVTPVIGAMLRRYVPQRDFLTQEGIDEVNERIRQVVVGLTGDDEAQS